MYYYRQTIKEVLQTVKPAQDKKVLRQLKTVGEVYPYMSSGEKKRLWHLLIKRITLYTDSFKIDWKNDIQTQGSLKTISRFGGDEGTYVRNIEVEKRINDLLYNLVESFR